jgi:hypothetical protein
MKLISISWERDHCSHKEYGNTVTGTRKEMEKHEKTCLENTENKACKTCKFSKLKKDGEKSQTCMGLHKTKSFFCINKEGINDFLYFDGFYTTTDVKKNQDDQKKIRFNCSVWEDGKRK